MGTARVGRGERGAPRPSSAVEHSEDLGSVEDQLGYQRQAAWAEDWEDNNTAGVTETEGEIVGHNGGAMGAVGAVSLPGADARRLHELAEAAAGGAAEGLERNPRATAQMRRACGDPLFFAHLKEDIGTRQRGGKKFLTHEEEMDLGTKVQRYRRLTEEKEAMAKSLGRAPILQEVEEASGLSREVYGGVMLEGMEARQRLVVSNLALVVSLASKYKRKNYDCSCLQTLVQEGTLGLIRAAERYDPEKGFRFTTYAIWWIEAKLRVSVQTEERMIHVPMWVKDKYKVVAKSIPALRKSLGRDPTAEELAEQVFIDTDSKVEVSSERVDQLRSWVSVHKHHISLDVRMKLSSPGGDDNLTKEDSIVAKDPSAEVTSDWDIRRKFLESCLAQDLTNVQQKIVRMRVGLDGGKRKNRREISRALKIPLESVVGEERKAFNKLGIFRGRGSPTFGDFT